MFVQDFVTIDDAYVDVVVQLVTSPETVLGGAVGPTRREGEQFRARVAPASWPSVLAKTVTVGVDTIRQFEDSVIVGFTWEAAGGASLFPRFDADLEVAPFGEGQTNVTIRGTYRPPAGLIGRQLDELVFHRLAEATVRAFLRNVCASLCRAGHARSQASTREGSPRPAATTR